MIRQYRPAAGGVNLEFPMCYVEGKTSLEMAKQELREEAGIVAKRWRKLVSFYPSIGIIKQEAHVFLAQDSDFYEPEPEEDEFIKFVEIPIEKFKEKVAKGEIKDSVTLSAYLLFNIIL